MKKYRIFLMLLTVTVAFSMALSGCKQCSSDPKKAEDPATEEKAKTDADKKDEANADKDHPEENK